VSSNVRAGIANYTGGARAARIFQQRKPVAQLGDGALLVYEGTFDLKPIVTEQRFQTAMEGWGKSPYAVIAEVEEIAASDPQNARSHYFLCDVYGLSGRFQDAERECNIGLDLDYANPAANLAEAKQRELTLKLNGLRIYHPHQTH